jgi:hypothetical protein
VVETGQVTDPGLICRLKFASGWGSCFGEKALLSLMEIFVRSEHQQEKWFMYGSCSSERVGAVGRGMHFWCFGGR